MTRTSRFSSTAGLVGLLLVGSLTMTFSGTARAGSALTISAADGLVSLSADSVPARDVVRAIARVFNLRLIEDVELDHPITLRVDRVPLHDVLADLLRNESYQLYVAAPTGGGDSRGSVPGLLWIFAEGSARAPAATLFLEAALSRGDLREKKEAIRELRRLGSTPAVQALSLALGDEDRRVRDGALGALQAIGSEEALAAIASATMASDPLVRRRAAEALAAGDGETSAEYLTLALEDPDRRVRMAVVEALADVPMGTVPGPRAVAALNQALRDEDPEVRMQALDSLEEIGGEIAFAALMQLKRDQDARVAEAAAESLSSVERRN